MENNAQKINCHIHVLGKLKESLCGIRFLWKKFLHEIIYFCNKRRINMKNINKKDIIIYEDDNQNINVEVMLIDDDIWLTQTLIASLFDVSRSTITEHINNIFSSGELNEKTSVGISDDSTGGRRPKLYNLDVIIAVGYRVNSKKAKVWSATLRVDINKKAFQ